MALNTDSVTISDRRSSVVAIFNFTAKRGIGSSFSQLLPNPITTEMIKKNKT